MSINIIYNIYILLSSPQMRYLKRPWNLRCG